MHKLWCHWLSKKDLLDSSGDGDTNEITQHHINVNAISMTLYHHDAKSQHWVPAGNPPESLALSTGNTVFIFADFPYIRSNMWVLENQSMTAISTAGMLVGQQSDLPLFSCHVLVEKPHKAPA